jgi:glyoxylase-like metal-dependent hydrolase (beta-lactamase superfamily II)
MAGLTVGGDISVHAIMDIPCFAIKLAMLFPRLSIADLEPHRGWLAPLHVDFDEGTALLAVQSHLVKYAGLNILVDTCVGEEKERPNRADWHRRKARSYLEGLAAFGLTPADIDVVLCTHLHADHVGWNTRLEADVWVPTFQNARYLIGANEFAHWQGMIATSRSGAVNHGSFDDSVMPIVTAGQVTFVNDGFDIAAGLKLRALPGHTPGQLGLAMDAAKGGSILFCGDAIHNPIQLCCPHVSSAFCADPHLAAHTRIAVLERAAEDGTIVIPAHLRGSIGMRVLKSTTSYIPEFVRGI